MKMTAKFNDWTEIPVLTGTIQPILGAIELESADTKPAEFGQGVIVARGKTLSFQSTKKMWVRAIGTADVGCNYGGF